MVFEFDIDPELTAELVCAPVLVSELATTDPEVVSEFFIVSNLVSTLVSDLESFMDPEPVASELIS